MSLTAQDYIMGFLTNIITFICVIVLFIMTFCWLDKTEHKSIYKRVSRNNSQSILDEQLLMPSR